MSGRIGEATGDGESTAGVTAFGPSEAQAFLDLVFAAPATEATAVALGTELHFGDQDVTGGALVWDRAVVHMAAFGTVR